MLQQIIELSLRESEQSKDMVRQQELHNQILLEKSKIEAENQIALKKKEEEMDELTELEYGNKRTFSLLSILFSGFDFSHHFHVDHVYPQGLFSKTSLKSLDLSEDEVEKLKYMSNCLPNLQLLEGTINNEKRAKMPMEWYKTLWPDGAARAAHLQAQGFSFLVDDLSDFSLFYDDRKKTLRSRISMVLNK
jgi:hypothetical protein